MIIDTKAVNVAPVIDPVGAVVCAADISNVETVLVDGKILKQDFKLDRRRSTARAGRSRRRATTSSATFGEPEPGWLPAKVTA